MIEMALADLGRALTNKLIIVLMKNVSLSLVGLSPVPSSSLSQPRRCRQVLRYGSMSRREYRQAVIVFRQKRAQAFCLIDPTKFL